MVEWFWFAFLICGESWDRKLTIAKRPPPNKKKKNREGGGPFTIGVPTLTADSQLFGCWLLLLVNVVGFCPTENFRG